MRNSKGQNATRARLLTCGATAAIVTACAFAVPVMAQDAAVQASSADDATTVVVTGIRRGIQDAISAKKKDSSIIEAVSAEDIGKLPDSSIAESIARLPGIAAQRTNGRAQTLSIRGLGPDYTVTTFNGREQASTNDNRTVEFDQYPSELVSQVKVYKTPDAAQSYHGIAGTADIETVHPLAYGKQAIALNYRREMNSMKSPVPDAMTAGDRYSATYIDQFFHKTVGLALGYAHNTTPYQAQTREYWGYPTCGSQCLPADANKIVVGGSKDGVQASYYKRDAFMGILEFKPNDQLHVTVDGFHSEFKEAQTIRRLEYGTIWGTGVLQPGYTADADRITSGTFNGITTIVENYNNERNATVDSLGVNASYLLNDKWTLNADVSYSKVHRTDLRLESTAGTGPAGSVVQDNLGFTTNADGTTNETSSFDYADFDKVFLTDPGGWGGGPRRSGYVGNPTVNDEIQAMKLAATRALGGSFFKGVTFGVNFADRKKDKYLWQSILYLPVGQSAVAVPEQYRTGTTDGAFFGNSNGIISYDAMGLYRSGFWDTIDARVDTNAGDGDRTFEVSQSWAVEEKLTTAYIKADIESTLFGVPVTGNIGAQYQYADQQVTQLSSPGVDKITPGLSPLEQLHIRTDHYKTTYGDFLPSANFNFALADDVSLRIAAAATVSRPRLDDMAGGVTYGARTNSNPDNQGTQQFYWSGSGGNPEIKPWKSKQFDLSLEKYFGRKGYLSAALYYKTLDSYVYNNSRVVDFSTLPGYTPPNDPAGCAVGSCYDLARANTTGVLTVKANGNGGHVQGAEFTASLPGETLWSALDGFGVIFSAAFNQSEVKPSGAKIELPGLSPQVINTTLYYEKHGFSARVSERYRDAWLGEVPNFDSSLGAHYVKAEALVDAQIGYEFQDGPAKGLTVNLSATNITNRPFVLYDTKDAPTNVLKYEKYGVTYAISVGYKFQ